WTNGPLWPYLLKPYFDRLPNASIANTQTRDAILQCPMAPAKFTPDTFNSPAPTAFEAYFTNHSSFGKVQASYGMNRWLYDATLKNGGTKYWLGNDPTASYTSLQRPKNGQIPLFFDCRWREARPSKNTEGYYPIDTTSDMSNVATQRHGQVVNVSFLD